MCDADSGTYPKCAMLIRGLFTICNDAYVDLLNTF